MAGVKADQQRLAVMAGASASAMDLSVDAVRLEHDAFDLPPDRGIEAGGRGPLHHPGSWNRGDSSHSGGAKSARKNAASVANGYRRAEPGSTTAGWLERARPAPDRVVGTPPLDGVDEAPALLEGPCRRRWRSSRLLRSAPEASTSPRCTHRSPASAARSATDPSCIACRTGRVRRIALGPGAGVIAEARRRSAELTTLEQPHGVVSAIVSRFASTARLQRGGAGARAVRGASSYSGTRGPLRNGGGFDLHVELDAPGARPDAQRLDGEWSFPASTPRPRAGWTLGPVPLQAEQHAGSPPNTGQPGLLA